MGCAGPAIGCWEKMPEPLITVVMPVYNAGSCLRAAVYSILAQTCRDFELLIIDDGSTDGAVDEIAGIEDPRIRIVRNSRNLGLAATLNAGIDLACGEYFARMDQDDVAYPERLEKQLALLRADPNLDLVAVRCITISAADVALGLLPWACTHESITARPWLGFYLPHPTWMARTEWFRSHRYHIPEIHLSEDQELLLRSYSESRFATVPEVLFAYRIRERKDWQRQVRSRRAQFRMQLSHFLGTRQFHFAALSLFAFCARTAMDLVNVLSGSRVGPHRRQQLDQPELLRWSKVQSALARIGMEQEQF